MRSLSRSDTVAGLVISAVLVAGGAFVLHVLAVHAKEHGHDGTTPLLDIEQVHGAEAKPRRKAEQGGGGHGFFSPTGVSQRHSTGLRGDE